MGQLLSVSLNAETGTSKHSTGRAAELSLLRLMLLCLDGTQVQCALKLSWPFLIFFLVYWGPLLDTLSFAICGLDNSSHFKQLQLIGVTNFQLWFIELISTHHPSTPLNFSEILSLPLGISGALSLLGIKTIDDDDNDDDDHSSSSPSHSEAAHSLPAYRNTLFSHEVIFERLP